MPGHFSGLSQGELERLNIEQTLLLASVRLHHAAPRGDHAYVSISFHAGRWLYSVGFGEDSATLVLVTTTRPQLSGQRKQLR